MTHTKPEMAQPQKRKKEKSKNEPQKQNQPHISKKNTQELKNNPKGKPLAITQINLNHAKVSSLTLQEQLDMNWSTDIKHIICIQEPYKNYKTGRIKNTSIHYKNYFSNKSKYPRAIIQVSKPYDKEIFFHEDLSDRDNCVISINGPKKPGKRSYISSIYMHETDSIEESQLNNITKAAYRKKDGLIVCSDTNAHSTTWGNDTNNKRGNDLENLIGKYDLQVANTDLSPTYHKGNNSSTIDLTLINEHAPKIINWKILKGESHSDHEKIQFEINQQNSYDNDKPRISRKCNTNHFKNTLRKNIRKTKFPLEERNEKISLKDMKLKIDKQASIITSLILDAWENTPNKKPSIKTKKYRGKWPEKIKSLSNQIAKLTREKNYYTKKRKKKTSLPKQ